MELGFIAHACRRHVWILVLGAVLGFVAGSVLGAGGAVTYRSEGLLSIQPSDASAPDRYVATQLVRLASPGLAETVAALPSVSLDPTATRNALVLEQIGGTDVVRVSATAESPELAQAIAGGYIDAYLDTVRAERTQLLEPQRTELQDSIAAVEAQLAEVDAQAETLTAPYLDRTLGIPSLDQLDPALATRRAALTEQYQRLLTAQAEFQRTADGSINSRVIEAARRPEEPEGTAQPLYRVAGLLLGLVLGVSAATVVARLSPVVTDRREAEELLGTAFVGSIARRRSLRQPLDRLLFGPAANEDAIRQIAVRAMAHVPEGAPLSVLVTGAQEVSGTSTVAALVAQHFAFQGRSVMLVDADVSTPDLSRQLAGDDLVATDDLIAMGSSRALPAVSEADRHRSGDVIIVAGFPSVEERPAHLVGASALVHGALLRADTVVIDGGPLMGSASTVQLSRECDVVVLAVPVARQRVDELDVVRDQLDRAGRVVLPIATPAVRRRRIGAAEAAPLEGVDPASRDAETAGAAR